MDIARVPSKSPWSHTVSLACCAAVVLSLVSGALAATIEEVEKEVIQAQGKLKSYSANTETRQDMEIGQGNRVKIESKGPMEWMHPDSKYLYRLELKSLTVTTVGGNETKSKNDVLMVCDGDFMYSLSDTDGQKSAIKAKVDPSQTGDVKGMFTAWRKDSILTVLPEEKVDGKECYVLDLSPRKKEAGDPPSRQKCWFRKDIGLPVKIVSFGKDDKLTMTSTMTDIKTDVELKPERFKFKLPEGVQLMDMTKMQAASAPASNPEGAKSEAPKESPKAETKPQAEEKPAQAEEKPQPTEEQKPPPEKKQDNAAKKVLKNLFK